MNKKILTKIIAILAILYGIMTIKAGGSILFIDEMRLAAGDYVPFVLWINFLLGFAYITAGIGLFLEKTWAKNLSFSIAGITLITFVALGSHIALGGLFKTKTLKAMVVRSVVWVGIAFYTLKKTKTNNQN